MSLLRRFQNAWCNDKKIVPVKFSHAVFCLSFYLSFFFTHNDLAAQTLVWLGRLRLRATRFNADSLRASCQQTCVTYTTAVCTVSNSS